MFPAIAILMVMLMGILSCQGGHAGSTEVTSGRDADASVSGTITYRERIALTPGARVIVELRDTSYVDAAAPLMASQTISNPGQVPIRFSVPYSRDDIDSRNTYSISARIIESDGRLAFTNDTAYDVITRGNPLSADMVLVLVEPPPDLLAELDEPDGDWRTWVDTPARVVGAGLIPGEPELLLRVAFLQSTTEGCARPGNRGIEVQGQDINVVLTLMQRPDTPWAIPCDDGLVELEDVFHIGPSLPTGKAFRVSVNGRMVATFTLPDPHLGYTHTAESLVQSAVVEEVDGAYRLRVVSGRPSGSCTQYSGYEVRINEPGFVNVSITHHQVSAPDVICTADFPIDETVVPLQLGLPSGEEYTVVLHGERVGAFVAP